MTHKKIFALLLMAIFLAGLSVSILYLRWHNLPVSSQKFEKEFIVRPGETIQEIFSNLEKSGFVQSKFFLSLYAILHRHELSLKSGRYVLSSEQSLPDILTLISAGKALPDEIEVRIIEGWDSQEIDNYLTEKKISENHQFLDLASTPLAKWPFNFAMPVWLDEAPATATIEGYLFPDTYRFFPDATPAIVIEKMLNNLNTKITQKMLDDIRIQNRTFHEIMILASIIEKEVSSVNDMKLVAGIFYNRLAAEHPLESCATLAYALGVNKPQYSYEDTQTDSLYNTYRHRGLPPGPIANPGMQAVMAAIYPDQSDYMFFLSDSLTGETIFSRTYEEHLRNKAKHLK